MNFFTAGMKIHKEGLKAMKRAKECGMENYAEQAYKNSVERQVLECEKAMDIGIQLMDIFKKKINITGNDNRKYLITIRPPYDTNLQKFITDVNMFINKYQSSFYYMEWAYEQVGECDEEIGLGFHVHIIAYCNKINYYPSHIIRDVSKIFTYVINNCIQVDSIKNTQRAHEYIRGIKNNDSKEAGVALNEKWRIINNLENLYSLGQVQTQAIP